MLLHLYIIYVRCLCQFSVFKTVNPIFVLLIAVMVSKFQADHTFYRWNLVFILFSRALIIFEKCPDAKRDNSRHD